MRCPRCRRENRPGAKFCEECAAPLVQVCQRCGAQFSPTAKFCSECAYPTGVIAQAESRFAAPDSYTPKHLAERILTSKAALEGERKQVTVLFADMKGSMELLADRDPEEAGRILEPVLERMMEAVHLYEGTVNQVMGDGIMALFGAPLAHEDHAVRACYAALRAQETVTQLRQNHRLDVQIRVGLNSGEVIVRSIGSDLRMDYTAMGQTAHLAARMEQLARPGTILLTSETLRLAEGYIEVAPLGPVPVKGLTGPIEIYELSRARAVRSRLQVVAARGLTQFVGRESELDHLGRVLDQAQAGYGQVVAVVGESGVGKSRLLWEFTHSRVKGGWLSLESGSVSYGKTTAYLPILDLLKGYFDILDRDDPCNVREKVTSKLFALDRALEPTLPALLALLDVPVEDVHWQALDPPQRRQRTLDAVRRLLLCESHVQPVLLVVEDLHWTDSETLALLDSLVEALPKTRLLLLVSYRPDYRHTWADKTHYTQLPIRPLSLESAGTLLQALLGDDPRLRPLRELLIDRTEGNPFFMEECVRSLAETQVLIGKRGAYHPAKPAHTIQTPATVQAVLASRIDRLDPDSKRLLQTASVVGKDVPLALLQGIAELPDETLRRSLIDLRRAEFLYERSLFPETEFTFKHALTHEVAYSSLLHPRRRALHARILEVMEVLYAGRLTEHVDRLAYHALRGEVWAKALGYLRQAGEKALTRSAYREAAAWFEQALATLDHLPQTPETRAHAIDLRFDLRKSLIAPGEHERILDYLREAETLAEALGDRRRVAWSLCYKTTYFWNAGEPDRAIESGHRALAAAAEINDLALEVVSNIGLSWAYHAVGDYRRAMGFLRRTLASLKGDLVLERFGLAGLPAVISGTWLAWCLAARGEFAESLARAKEGVQIARSVDHPYSLAIAYFGLGFTHLHKGELHEAVSVLTPGLELSRTFNIRPWFTALASALGYAHALLGRVAEALPLLAEAVDVATAMRSKFRQSQRVAWLSEALVLAGRREEAIPLALQALELARRHKERGHEAHVLRLLGDIGVQSDLPDTPSPEAYYRLGLTLASELEMLPLIAQCQLGLGQLSQRAGTRRQAEEHLTTAAALFREMDMQLWRDRSEAALSALS